MSKNIQQKWLKSAYRPKDCDLSVTDLCMPAAQLWAKLHTEKDTTEEGDKTVGLASFIGSAVHKTIEEIDEDGVVKEFSWVKTTNTGLRVGGTADELRWMPDESKWRLGDIKVKGDYPAKKFLGIGSKSNPTPKPEQEKEQLQLSIYRWLFEGMFDIMDEAIIYLFIVGKPNYAKYPDKQEVPLNLLEVSVIDKYINQKMEIATSERQPTKDCPTWLCNYCEYQDVCNYYDKKEEDCMKGFADEQ